MAPEWIKPGAKVAIVSTAGWYGTVTLDTVEKILTRDIVLASGRRFSEQHGSIRERGKGRGYSSAPKLAHPSDPEVAEIIAERRKDAARAKADKAFDKWRRRGEDVDAVIEALQAWKALP